MLDVLTILDCKWEIGITMDTDKPDCLGLQLHYVCVPLPVFQM